MRTQRRSILARLTHRSALPTNNPLTSYSNDDDDDDDDRSLFSRLYSRIHFHKVDIYHILERQQGKRTLIYHLFVFVLNLFSFVLGSIATIDEWQLILNQPLYYTELGLCIFFTYELILRIWSAGCRAKYRTWVGRLMFVTHSVIILDIITLLGFALSLATGIKTGEFPIIVLKFLPLLQMIRFIRVDRQLTSWTILKGVILEHHQELLVTIVIGFMFLIIGAYLIYVTETPIDPRLTQGSYKSMADSMWFSIVTMTTIGFGDLYPTTFNAKIVTTTIIYLGVAFWCLPGGIIGSGLAIKVQEQKRDEAVNRLIPAAANVIRNWWRLKCAFHDERFVATWQIYSLIEEHPHTTLPQLNQESGVGAPLKKTRSSNTYELKSLLLHRKNSERISHHDKFRKKPIVTINDLPRNYITAIKVYRLLKYSLSCKKFHQAKHPVNLKDVVHENTQMNVQISSVINDIQRRLDITLGTKKLAPFLSDEHRRPLSLSSRIENVEQITYELEEKLNCLETLTLSLIQNK